MDRWIEQMQTPPPLLTMTLLTTTLQHPNPRPMQTASPLTHPTPLIQLPEQTQVAVENQPESDQTLTLMTMSTTTTKPTDFPHQHQPDSLPTPSQPSNLPPAAAKREPSNLAAMQRQLLHMQQESEWLYPSLVELMKQLFHQPTVLLPTAPPTHDNIFPAPAHSNPTPAPPTTHTTHSTQPALSMTERMTINTTHNNNSLWLPEALHRRHTLHRTSKTSQLADHLPACQLSLFPLMTTAIPAFCCLK